MPIRLLSLPIADVQYALECMDIDELIAFSLCSNRTKNLVKSSHEKILTITAEIDDNMIKLEMFVFGLGLEKEFKFVVHEGPSIEFHRGDGIEFWRREGFTQNDWIAHFLSLCHPRGKLLKINNVSTIACLDTVQQPFPKFFKLQICGNNSVELTRAAVSKFSSVAHVVSIESNPFDDENHISEFLNLNLEELRLENSLNPYKVDLNDLLLTNSTSLTIQTARITEKKLNRFVKIWMKGNRRFYRPKYIGLILNREINREDVLRGIKYQTVNGQEHRLKRLDGKELLIFVGRVNVSFEFR